MPLSGVEILGIVSGSSFLAAAISAWASRRAATAQNEVTRFEAIVNALDQRIADLKDQLDQVRRDLDLLHQSYLKEVDLHQKTRSHLRAALDHIRSLLYWIKGDRLHPIPKLPPELEELL